MITPSGEHLVFVVNRTEAEAEDNDAIVGVWEEEKDLLPDLRAIFEGCATVRIEGSRVLATDEDGQDEEPIAYITRCFVQ